MAGFKTREELGVGVGKGGWRWGGSEEGGKGGEGGRDEKG